MRKKSAGFFRRHFREGVAEERVGSDLLKRAR